MQGTLASTVLVLVLALAATGCGDPERGSTTPDQESHTMPDGSVMEGPTHIHDDSHDHASGDGEGPSDAARMVCAGQVVDDVARIMGEAVTPTSDWQDPVFSCTFALEGGPIVLTVHDADERSEGMAHFQQARLAQPEATPIRGVYSLGLPAYETLAGTVSFVRDGKTLEVDATGLRDRRLGAEQDRTRTEIAYAVATSVLACWTAHD